MERQGDVEYSLDKTEDSIKEFEKVTGIKAGELLDTGSLIRRVYGETLNKLIEMRYQELCAKIKKAAISVIVMWAMYVLIWRSVRLEDFGRILGQAVNEYSSQIAGLHGSISHWRQQLASADRGAKDAE